MAASLFRRSLSARDYSKGVGYFSSVVPSSLRTARVPKAKLSEIYGGIINDKILLPGGAEEIADILNQRYVFTNLLSPIARIIRSLGRLRIYEESFFQSISQILERTSNKSILLSILPSFLWACTKVRYYSPSLLDSCSGFITGYLNEYSSFDLATLVHAYAKLNHPLPQLISSIEKYLLNESVEDNHHLAWTLAWSGMVMGEYPKELLSVILKDDYILDTIDRERSFLLLILFQLKISLNMECLDSGLGLGWDSAKDILEWGAFQSGLKGISNKVFQKAIVDKIYSYHTAKHSLFGSNICRALNNTLHSADYVQNNALSLCGYIFDFEVLMDDNGEPIHVPSQWKNRRSELLAASVGVALNNRDTQRNQSNVSDDLLGDLKELEKNRNGNMREKISSIMSHVFSNEYVEFKSQPISLASDWGLKFKSLSRHPCRKIVIEGDGDHHYAINCDNHVLGSTVLKRRHIESLGWELKTVHFKDWDILGTGDSQTNFMHSLIFNNR